MRGVFRRSLRRFAVFVSIIFLAYFMVVFFTNYRTIIRSAQRSDEKSSKPQHSVIKSNSQSRRQKVRNEPQDELIYLPDGVSTYPNYIKNNFIAPNRIFHIDLKGAAPRIDYLLKLIPFIKQIGATGILIEYEDMFPFIGLLDGIKAKNAYTEDDIKRILRLAVKNKLDIIPLVQTVGHLEYILKYAKFAHFRQEERYPQVICFCDEEAVSLVTESLKQVLNLHKEFSLRFVHIGADEVFQVGRCAKDREFMAANSVDSEYLLLRHISRIAKFVKAQLRKDVNVMVWHDMLGNVQPQNVNNFNLGELVEPVVWNYAENLDDQLFPDFWHHISSLFPCVWGASAFKGADGPDQYASNVPHYLANHLSWLKQMNNYHARFKQFRGLIVTGWQRFDHFAILCETLPVGLLSAAVNFGIIKNGEYSAAVLRSVTEMLKCSSQLYFDKPNSIYIPQCEFPGVKVFNVIQTLHSTLTSVEEQVFHDYQIRGWMSEFNEVHAYSQIWYVDQAIYKVKSYLRELQNIERQIRMEMGSIFFNDTITEFIYIYVKPAVKRIEALSARIDKLSELRTFSQRPFDILER